MFAFLNALPNHRRLDLDTGEPGTSEQLAGTLNLSGNDLNDTSLAALALASALTVVTADQGFARFAALRLYNPG